jgi:molybdopterin-guanine dinucleotide biosynthesis protein A
VDGTRIIDRVATALRAVTDDLLLAANAPDAQDWLPGVRAVRDTRGERGSLVAIHTALTTAAGDDVLIVAWDMPFVSVGLLRTLHERLTPDVDAVVPESVHGLEPFCAAYSSRVLPHVERAIASGDLRVTRMIDALPRVARLTPENLAAFGVTESTFFNVNTAADLDAAERMARGD